MNPCGLLSVLAEVINEPRQALSMRSDGVVLSLLPIPTLCVGTDKVVRNAKVLNTGQENCNRMVAATFQSTIQLWSVMVNNDGSLVTREISQSVR
ncbi:hypothetical protein LSAT2_002463 [Lamellibrachia satsuma]|nr:hypothetical protein LSAT2_002463 [Lamellibrachia satsuma]